MRHVDDRKVGQNRKILYNALNGETGKLTVENCTGEREGSLRANH